MGNDIASRRRRSVRLLHYSYGDAGACFITLCVHHRACLFGAVVDGAMVLDDVGKIVAAEWHRTPVIRSQVALDEFIVMPNHFHAIVTLKSSRRGVLHTPSEKFHSPSQTLGAIVRGFKAATTKRINEVCQRPVLPYGNGIITSMSFETRMSWIVYGSTSSTIRFSGHSTEKIRRRAYINTPLRTE